MTTFGIYITVVSFQTINEETAILVSKYCRREHGCVMITARSRFWLVCWEGLQTGVVLGAILLFLELAICLW